MISLLTVIGTRPEAIKLAPLLQAIEKEEAFESRVCLTRQHTDLLDPFLDQLNIRADYEFEPASSKRSLHPQVASLLVQFDSLFASYKPDLVIVQGDTTTAFVASLAAFYSSIPVAHVEAGLRTGDKLSPWPEEAHRVLIDRMADFFFVPTLESKQNLLLERVDPEKIWVVGNTSIDALRFLSENAPKTPPQKRPYVMVTIHRRENHGEPLKNVCAALLLLSEEFPEIDFLFFLHPNPHVAKPAEEMLQGKINIHLLSPLDHLSFTRLLKDCLFVLTDSGGVQEEAPFFGKPLIVARDTTERMEGVLAGTAELVGTSKEAITEYARRLLLDEEYFKKMSRIHFPYGDGYASKRIVDVLLKQLIPNLINKVTFELRESCQQTDDRKWHSINSIQCHL